jgi:hypothetical protein
MMNNSEHVIAQRYEARDVIRTIAARQIRMGNGRRTARPRRSAIPWIVGDTRHDQRETEGGIWVGRIREIHTAAAVRGKTIHGKGLQNLDRAGVSREHCKHAEGLWAIQSSRNWGCIDEQ